MKAGRIVLKDTDGNLLEIETHTENEEVWGGYWLGNPYEPFRDYRKARYQLVEDFRPEEK